jgi:4-diphosphocytidyl-2-C-methyl-D-erythritol kinase
MTIVESAPCKVNLTLDVFRPRVDGFHDIDSVVATFTPMDSLAVQVAPSRLGENYVHLTCSDPRLPVDGRNLAHRAATLFLEAFAPDDCLQVSLHLEKSIPYEAGLGGGSSDAAAALRALSRAISVHLGDLYDLAASLGSDVPLFLAGEPARIRGRGDRVDALRSGLPPLIGVIVKPDVGVATGPAYERLDSFSQRVPGASTQAFLARVTSTTDSATIAGLLHNDFEAAILPAVPETAQAHRALASAGALRAILCGSGAAVFGLARDREHAREIARQLCGKFPYVKIAASREGVGNGG